METVLVARISYMATTYDLLPKMYFGSRQESCVEIAIYYLLEKIYVAWNKNKIASFL